MKPTETIKYVTTHNSFRVSSSDRGAKKRIYDFIKWEYLKRGLEVGILIAALLSFLANAAVAVLQHRANKTYRQSVELSRQSIDLTQKSIALEGKAYAISQDALYDAHAPWVDIQCSNTIIDGHENIVLFFTLTNTSDAPAFGFHITAVFRMEGRRCNSDGEEVTLMPHIPVFQTVQSGFPRPDPSLIVDPAHVEGGKIKLVCNYRDIFNRQFQYVIRLGIINGKTFMFNQEIFIDYTKDKSAMNEALRSARSEN